MIYHNRHTRRTALPVLSGPDLFKDYTGPDPQMSWEDYQKSTLVLLKHAPSSPVGSPMNNFWRLWNINNDPQLSNLRLNILCSEEVQNIPVPIVYEMMDTEAKPPPQRSSIHVFIDKSNISAGFQGPNPTTDVINPAGLAEVIEKGRVVVDKQITGSFPGPEHPVWLQWKNLGYRTRVSRKQGKEEFIDDSIHAQILRLIAGKGAPQTIVLVTGDGNSNNNYSSFVECVTMAAERNWVVELYSWKDRRNKVYVELSKKFSNITIHDLDRFKGKILVLQ